MKIGIFTDSHYSSAEVTCDNRYNSKSLIKINEAFNFFKENKCDMIISLGDIIDKEKNHNSERENLKKIRENIDAFNIPFYSLMGNHDAFSFTEKEFYNILGENRKPENITSDNYNMIFLDTCYFKNGNHYMPGDTDWTDTYYPFINKLKKKLNNTNENIYIFMHHNIDPTVEKHHIVSNAEDIRKILEDTNKNIVVFQGHFHKGSKYKKNNVLYITLPAMCSNEKAYYIYEI